MTRWTASKLSSTPATIVYARRIRYSGMSEAPHLREKVRRSWSEQPACRLGWPPPGPSRRDDRTRTVEFLRLLAARGGPEPRFVPRYSGRPPVNRTTRSRPAGRSSASSRQILLNSAFLLPPRPVHGLHRPGGVRRGDRQDGPVNLRLAKALSVADKPRETRVKIRLGGPMKRLVVGIVAAAVMVSMARSASAQAKTVSSEMRTETATVEAVEVASRTITLKKPDGTFVQTDRRARHQTIRGNQGRRQGQRQVLRERRRAAEEAR